MKATKLIIGILSCILCIAVLFQSCSARLVTAVEGNTNDLSASSGILFMIALLVAGITGLATRKSKGGGIVAFIFYLIAGIIGVTSNGVYKDLVIWGGVALLFALLQFVCSVFMRKEYSKHERALFSPTIIRQESSLCME